MPITETAETREFHLYNDRVSYVMRVLENGALGHLHAPASHEPGQHLAGLVCQFGREKSARLEFPQRVAHQHPANCT